MSELARQPLRFSQLHEQLPGLGSNLLAARLRSLERAGVIARHALPGAGNGAVYELSDRGRELRPALRALARWGAGTLAMTQADDAGTPIVYRPAPSTEAEARSAAGDVYEWRVGDGSFHIRVSRDHIEQWSGPAPSADLRITLRSTTLERLAVGPLTWSEARSGGLIDLEGPPDMFARMLRLLGLEARPPS